MTHRKLRQLLYDLISSYFDGATAVWSKTKLVQPRSPLIVLTMGSVRRHYQPITQAVNGVTVSSYPSKTTVQVDLFTKGATWTDDTGITAAMENTAVNDLLDFVNFVNSAYVDAWSDVHDVSILANQVHDLTSIINDTSWDYRAMIELEVRFTQTAVGYTGTMSEDGMPYHENGKPKYDSSGYPLDENGSRVMDEYGDPLPPVSGYDCGQTASGGRSDALAKRSAGWFEQVDSPEYEKEEDSPHG